MLRLKTIVAIHGRIILHIILVLFLGYGSFMHWVGSVFAPSKLTASSLSLKRNVSSPASAGNGHYIDDVSSSNPTVLQRFWRSLNESTLPIPKLHLHTAGGSGELSRRGAFSSSGGEGSFVPSWKIIPSLKPYMGNLTCQFESAQYDIESQRRPGNLTLRRDCGRMRFWPRGDWVAPDPVVAFERLPHDSTIWTAGDSISRQQGSDLMCSLASVSELVRSDVERVRVGFSCPDENECDVDYGGRAGPYTLIDLARATFRLAVDGSDAKDISVVSQGANFGLWNPSKVRQRFSALMDRVKKNDIFVLNQGLHYQSEEMLLYDINAIKPVLLSAMNRGVKVIWRETNAAHFDTPNGYYSPGIKMLQENRSAHCVASSRIDATLSRNQYNGKVTPLMKSLGIPVLATWEATFLLPEYCYVGNGKDCAHFLQPGATSFFTDSLLKYIEEEYEPNQAQSYVLKNESDAFCGNCPWINPAVDCFERVSYVVQTYHSSYEEARAALLERGECVNPDYVPPSTIEREPNSTTSNT